MTKSGFFLVLMVMVTFFFAYFLMFLYVTVFVAILMVLWCRKGLGVLRDVFFLLRKASAGNAAHLAQHDEGIGIHLVNHLLRAVQLPGGDDAGKHIGFNAQVTGLSVQQGDASVDVCQNGILHLLGMFGDDFQFGFGGAQCQQLVQRHGVYDNQNDAVEAGVLIGEEHLAD